MTLIHLLLNGDLDGQEIPEPQQLLEETFALMTCLMRSMEAQRKSLIDKRLVQDEQTTLISLEDIKTMEKHDKLQKALFTFRKGKGSKGYKSWKGYRPYGKGGKGFKGGRGLPPPKFSFLSALQRHGPPANEQGPARS